MKQPELGQTISKLRKEKGLTQEELVERCNINVRTIQRIESGEVTPRSYTIKSILGAMNLDLNAIKTNLDVTENKMRSIEFDLSNKIIRQVKIAFFVGVLFLILYLLEPFLSTFFYIEELNFAFLSYFIFKTVLTLCLACFYFGFYNIGKIIRSSILKISALLILSFGVLANSLEILVIHYDESLYTGLLFGEGILFGILGIPFGIAIYKLQNHIGILAIIAAIAELIVAVLLISIIFAETGAMLSIIAVVLELIVMYKCYETFKKNLNSTEASE